MSRKRSAPEKRAPAQAPSRNRGLCGSALLLAAGLLLASQAAADEALRMKAAVLRAEAGAFTERGSFDGGSYLHGAFEAGGSKGAWEYALGLRFDAHAQSSDRDFTRGRLDYGENYLRWRGDDLRVTLGTQKILWGRVDEISTIDRMSRVDLSRGVLDKLPERRRALPALRIERFAGDLKIDAVWLPLFDEGEMPDRRSVWHPVDTRSGRLMGIGKVPLLVGARVRAADHDHGGGGVRITRSGDSWDQGISLQRVRQSQPYYRVAGGALQAIHPYSTVLGAELETERWGATWRMEATWSSDVPVTTRMLRYDTEPGFDMVLGAEFFPADGDTRVTLQLAGHRTFTNRAVLDRTETYAMTGEIEHPFGFGRWRAELRFFAGLGERDLYLNPRLSYIGIDQHEIFIAAHLFSGRPQTLGGHYADNDMIVLGWQARF